MATTEVSERSIKIEFTSESELAVDSCRLCMARSTAMKQLFDTRTNTVEMIRFCTGVEFIKEDDLPTQICKSCSEDLSIAHAFKTLCLSADKTFKKYLISNETKLHKSLHCEESEQRPPCLRPPTDEARNNISDNDEDYKDFLEHSSYEIMVDVVTLKDKMNEIEQEPNGLKKEGDRFECHICQSIFTSRKSWKNHLLQEHGLATPVRKPGDKKVNQVVDKLSANFISDSVKEGKFFECDVCHSCFRYQECWKKHLLQQHGVPLPVEGPRNRVIKKSANKNDSQSLPPLSKDRNRNNHLPVIGYDEVLPKYDDENVNHGVVETIGKVGELETNTGIGEIKTESNERFFCHKCQSSCLTRKGWRKHQLRTHGVKEPEIKRGRRRNGVVKEPSANEINISESEQGLTCIDNNKNSCFDNNNEACNEKVTKEVVREQTANLSEMCKLETEDGVRFYCPICYSSCSTRKGWRRHQIKKHGVTVPSLKTGPKKKQTAGAPSAYKNIVFAAKDVNFLMNLGNKKVVQNKKTDYICEVCGKVFKHMGSRHTHLRSHLPASFFCDHCEYKTPHKSDLLKHIRIHSGVKMYRCEHCPLACYTSSNLLRHIRCIHDRIKPFQCPMCEHKSSDKRRLKSHIDTHNGIHGFQCDICYTGFGTRHSWKKHMVRQHGVVIPLQKCGRRKENRVVGEPSAKNII